MSGFFHLWKKLEIFWSEQGCTILPSYDMEMGAATFHPATVFGCTARDKSRFAYLQPCRRPADSLSTNSPSRFAKFHQFQVIIKEDIEEYLDIQKIFIDSLTFLGFEVEKNNLEFVESEWNSPTLGAYGFGWEVRYNSMEICQITLFNQMVGSNFKTRVLEYAYGVERLLLKYFDSNNIYELPYDNNTSMAIFHETNCQLASYYSNKLNIFSYEDMDSELQKIKKLIGSNILYGAYNHLIKANHVFNCLDSQNLLNIEQRREYVIEIQRLFRECFSNIVANKIPILNPL